MRASLRTWIADAETLRYVDRLRIGSPPELRSDVARREDDYYVALVGELFERLRAPGGEADDWAALGNAFGEYGFGHESAARSLVPSDTALFAAAAYYLGGFSASAYLMLRDQAATPPNAGYQAAVELLARPREIASDQVVALLEAVRTGDMAAIDLAVESANRRADAGRLEGPGEWVGWRLYQELVGRFRDTNLRQVLPDGGNSDWNDLVDSFLSRSPPVWDFFPSQIRAIAGGLITSENSFALQMPTGAGKTTLIETVLYWHLRRSSGVAIVLVPFRALAAELEGTLVRRLNETGINARAMYGGTVPTGDETHALEDVRALVATPESLSGLLSANASFQQAIDLVVCDEGHLLDGGERGVALELLLARLKARRVGPPRFVFISAIVPNIEEVNAWLGGTDETVVRSDFRPALAEFARLDVTGSGVTQVGDLRLHPHRSDGSSFVLSGFLSQDDFRYYNDDTRHWRTYAFSSIKTRAVAAARKSLHLGAVAVFAANKRGNQGCVGLAEELLAQLEAPLSLPKPEAFVAHPGRVAQATDYLEREYGMDWVGTRALRAGAAVHHGDVPQESREVLELLVRQNSIPLAFCTSTLAEGVNLPIRTIVLYSVRRQSRDGRPVDLLAREIKNLVGRAGRAGSSTRGLVICANEDQWSTIAPVALEAPGEPVKGALVALLQRLYEALLRRRVPLTNMALESTPALHPLVDGVDLTLIDLAAEEIDEAELLQVASELTAETYAAQQVPEATEDALREVFRLRAERILEVRRQGRLPWIQETGARVRMLELVESDLLPKRHDWTDVAGPTDPALVEVLIGWARALPNVEQALEEVDREGKLSGQGLIEFVTLWLDGHPVRTIAHYTGVAIDDALAVLSRVVGYELHTTIEQGVTLLRRLCESRAETVADAVMEFPEHLRLGVPTGVSLDLASATRHRRAAVALGQASELTALDPSDREGVLSSARSLLDDTTRWLPELGPLVLERTKQDLRRYAAHDQGAE